MLSAADRHMLVLVNNAIKLMPTHKPFNYALIVDGELIDGFLSLDVTFHEAMSRSFRSLVFASFSPFSVFIVCYVQHSFSCNLIYQPNRIE